MKTAGDQRRVFWDAFLIVTVIRGDEWVRH